MQAKPMCSANPTLTVGAPTREQVELGAAEAEECLQLELAEVAGHVAQAEVGRLPSFASPRSAPFGGRSRCAAKK